MKGLCLIVSGGDFSRPPEEILRAEYIIACDKGYEYAQRLSLAPDLIIGDFDSAPQPSDGRVERVPSEKDDTDTMLAARRALEGGWRDIAVCCAFGGRLDHTFANIQTGAFIASHGGRARLFGADTEAAVINGGSIRLPRREGWSLSLFALSDRCEGVAISGAKYSGEGFELCPSFPLGVSNVWSAEAAEISVKSGLLLVLQSKLKPGEHI
jgi:thiamine pyrophosphokinase